MEEEAVSTIIKSDLSIEVSGHFVRSDVVDI